MNTLLLERYVTENETRQFRGDEVFFSTFPAHEEDRVMIGRFPFKVTVACPYKRIQSDKVPDGFQPCDAPYQVLLNAIHAMGIIWHWSGGAAQYMTPSDQQEKQFRRYSIHESTSYPVVVNIETDLPPEAVKEENFRLYTSDIIRLHGFCSILSRQKLFLSADTIYTMFPIAACRCFKPKLKRLDITRMFYSCLGKEYQNSKPEDIPHDAAVWNVFERLYAELDEYRTGKQYDAFTDYAFDLIKALALRVSNAKSLPLHLCPLCLHRVPEGSRTNRIYFAPKGHTLLRERKATPGQDKETAAISLKRDNCQRRGPRLANSAEIKRDSAKFLAAIGQR